MNEDMEEPDVKDVRLLPRVNPPSNFIVIPNSGPDNVVNHEQQLENKFNEFNEIINTNPLKAPKKYEEIVQVCQVNHLSSEKAFEAAKILADFIKNSSIFKQRKMDAAIRRINILSKVILAREFRTELSETMSLQSALSIPINSEEYGVIKDIRILQPRAYGMNRNGRLGVGVTDRKIEKHHVIDLPKDVMISRIYMGKYHTIFLSKNGDFYGSGLAKNFMTEGPLTGNILTPVKLDYVKIPKDNAECLEKTFCTVTDRSTTFHDYNQGVELVIGQACDKQAISKGPNWITQAEPPAEDDLGRVNVKLMSVVTWKMMTYTVTPSGWYTSENTLRPIVFYACGRRVSPSNFQISICPNGSCYAVNSGKLYKGKLVTGPRKLESEGLDDDEKQEEILVVFLKELVVPFKVDGFFVNDADDSMIFYPRTTFKCPHHPTHVSEVKKITSPLVPPTAPLQFPDEISPCFASTLKTDFSTHFNSLPADFASLVYSSAKVGAPENDVYQFRTGLPINGINYARQLLALQHFLRIDETSQVPVVLKSLDLQEESAAFENGLKEAVKESLVQGSYIKPLMEENWRILRRNRNVAEKVKIYWAKVIADITKSLECLEKLPLKYRRLQRDTTYGHFVSLLIAKLDSKKDIAAQRPKNDSRQTKTRSKAKLDQLYANRVQFGDVDKEDPKFKPVHVHCIPVKYEVNDEGQITNVHSHCFYTTVTEFYIKVIHPGLLEYVEDGILNLNWACLNGPFDLNKCIDVFFQIDDICQCLHTHKNLPSINNQKICENLPSEEKYTISTSDNKKVEVPAYLFQLYAGAYDSGRRRSAEMSGTPVDQLSVRVSARAVELLVETLLDPSRFFNFDNTMKEQIFKLSHEMMIKHLETDMLRMIIMSLDNNSCRFVKWLFTVFPDKMVEEVGLSGRSDILLFWDELPFDHSTLDVLNGITDYWFKNCYEERSDEDMPVTLLPDVQVDEEQLDENWLFDQLCVEKDDKDIKWSLMNTMMLWNGYEKKGVKRSGSSLSNLSTVANRGN